MSGRLVGEVAEWLMSPIAEDLTTAERAVLMIVAERAHEHTRVMLRHRVDDQSLIERISRISGLSIETGALKKTFQRLAKRGLEVRVAKSVGKDGRPIFAYEGQSAGFALPRFPASVTVLERGDHSPPSKAERGDQVPASRPLRTVDNYPAALSGRTAEGSFSSPLSTQRGEHSPQRGELSPQRGEPVPPLSTSSTSSPSSTNTSPSLGLRSSRAELEGDGDPPLTFDQDRYKFAMGTLLNLPDGGQALLAQAAADHPDDRHELQIIHAASLARIPA